MLSIYMVQLFANFSLGVTASFARKFATPCRQVESQQLRLCGPLGEGQADPLDLRGPGCVGPVNLKFGKKVAVNPVHGIGRLAKRRVGNSNRKKVSFASLFPVDLASSDLFWGRRRVVSLKTIHSRRGAMNQ